ncbi:ribosome biogenesis/translation initiation ATPase RLI [archaeon]|jgi:ATP-binding cassette, sub-family E, member 1|nr:ribosome biogenesis/translation initiation ATPase RLI [archaeon]MBT4441537.1 ribosome biogenesis/translation initiation ATPase RLI [archaeon]
MSRLAILDKSKCIQGTGCDFICGKYCPVNRTGGECIVLDEKEKPIVDEGLCNGCGICPKRCPVGCIGIINLPEELKEDPIHRYGKNAFELFRLPIPKEGKVVGILGRNGIGKTTALQILSSAYVPNLGHTELDGLKEQVIGHYSTVTLGEYFKKLYNKEVKIAYKPQRIELIPQIYKGTVGGLIDRIDTKGRGNELLKELGLYALREREIAKLSGGELQKLAIIATAIKDANFLFFDEPASFLDITSRIKVAKLIASLAKEGVAVMVVEHDLATLDYISDEIQIVYGKPAAFGVISQSKSVRRGINEYLDGYLPDDNIRFRDYAIKFSGAVERSVDQEILFEFPALEKEFESFKLKINAGEIRKGELLAIMGANGLGKTTFLKLLAGIEKPTKGEIKGVNISYKPQYIEPIHGTVRQVLMEAAKDLFSSGWYKQNILEKLNLKNLLDNDASKLSGGELQKLYVAVTLSKDADVYAFDEPSAFIDVEDRLKVAEIIKDFMIKREKCAIIVDHDVQFIDFVGDSMLVFKGEPGKEGHVMGPLSKKEGMNEVLKMLDITYRLDKETQRPRINKLDSQLDKTQRSKGMYYYDS